MRTNTWSNLRLIMFA